MKDIIDLHTHTLASGHAYSTINEMAQAAAQKGIELLGITEHAPTMPGTCHLYYFENLHVVPREMYGVKLLFGSEVNIMDYEGNLDLEDRVLKKLDIGIASIHPPCFTCGTKQQNTNAVIGAIKNPYILIIGHPDDGRFPLDYEQVVTAAKKYGAILEVNNASVAPGSFRPNTKENDLEILRLCKQYEVPVIMGSDAHVAADVGRHDFVSELIKKADFPTNLVMNDKLQILLEMNRRKREDEQYSSVNDSVE